MQDMPLGMGTSVLYLCPKGMDVVGLILAIPLILKGSGFLEARWGQASGGDSSGLPGVAILMQRCSAGNGYSPWGLGRGG